MKRKLGLIALLMVMVVLLTACGNGLEGPTWKMKDAEEETTWTFKGGKVTINIGGESSEGTYKIDGNKITINPPADVQGQPLTAEFKVEGNKLTLSGGEGSIGSIEFEKK